jgi:Ca-activated chloride channel homolog
MLLALAAAVPVRIAAQEPDPPSYSESAGAEYVMLPVLVTDKDGKYVEGLTKDDFVIRVGDSRVDFDTFERDEGAPVSFAFLVDTSGSMGVGSKLENAKNAIRSILRNRVPGDDFALFTFSEGKVRLVSDSSPDPAGLVKELWDLEASGQTALFDAVAMTPELMKGRNNKRAIVLFTDGVDNASELSAAKMAEILQRVSVPVYAIGMKNASFDVVKEQERREMSIENLELLAGSSGGKMHLVGRDDDLRPLAARISSEVRQQYLLGFAPSGKGDVKYRIVFVSVAKPGSWVVRTRRGYRGTAPGGS